MSTRVYLIGAGVISHHHAQACSAIPGAELRAADPNAAAREKFREAFPEAELFGDSGEMLAPPAREGDMVVVATPPRFHVPEALKALRSGRSVLVEKPLALNMEEAEELWTVAKSAGLHIGTCGNRFQSWSLNRLAGEKVADGSVGEVYLVDWIHRQPCQRTGIEYQNGSWWFLDKRQNGGGPLMDWGPYDLNVLLSIFEPAAVTVDQALCEHPEVPAPLPEGVVFDTETQAVASLSFETAGGRRVRVRYERTSATHGEARDEVGVYGSTGFMRWDWLPFGPSPELAVRRTTGSDGAAELETVAASTLGEAPNWIFEPLLRFRDYLAGGTGVPGRYDARALDALRVIQAIYRSAERGEPVRVELAGPESI